MEQRKKIGLALGGGGSKGLAHIGVIKALKEAKIPIDYIAGTSMGALIGGWYAMDKSTDKIEEAIHNMHNGQKHLIGEVFKHSAGGAFIKGKSALTIIDELCKECLIEDCEIPFKAIATDVKNGDMVVIDKGPLASALKASSAIPVVFDPVQVGDKLLIDGGLANPIPADIVRAMGADIVIAVDVSSKWFDISNFHSGVLNFRHLYSIFSDLLSAIANQISRTVLEQADVVLHPPVLGYDWLDLSEADDIIHAGYKEVRDNLRQICHKTGCVIPPKTLAERFVNFFFED